MTFAFVIGELDVVSESAAGSGLYPFRSSPGAQGLAFHRASEAVAWSLATQRHASDVGVGLQVGIHSGEPELTRQGYFGPAVNIASQLATAAAPGSTLATAVTALLAGMTDAVDLGLRSLDGVTGPQRVVRLDGPPKSSGAPWTPSPGNLPMRPQQLVGRDTEIAAVVGLLRTPGVMTLVGPGGIGKTSLALAAAHHERVQSDRACWYVELADITTPEEIPAAVAQALGINDEGATTLTDAVVRFLQATSDLLVVDNCEHVVAGAAEFVVKIAQHCPNVRILATSREGLGIAGEQLFVVTPLVPETEGVELFTKRAAEAALTFDPSSDGGAVSGICRRLDGVPLAIELAAARVRTLTPTEIVSRLDDHLMLLTDGRRTSVERHRTLSLDAPPIGR